MISSYRLGDLFEGLLNESETNLLIEEHPNTIGAKYAILSKRFHSDARCIQLMTKIVLGQLWKYSQEHKIPEDIETSTVLHVRIGDVVGGNEYHEKWKRPLELEHLKTVCPKNQKTYVIGKCFFAAPSSTNYDECIELSNQYVSTLLEELEATQFDGGHADIDLCCAIKAKTFIQGRGYFSKLIVSIRKILKLESIETETEIK